MKCAKLFVMLFILTISSTAEAGKFGDSFKNWVLGPEASAHTRDAVDIKLDSIAQGCMQCHSGKRGATVQIKSASSPMQYRGHINTNHPVGMFYDAYANKQSRAYRPRTKLDPNIKFVNGQVSCVSCHQIKQDVAQNSVIHVADATNKTAENCSASDKLTVGTHKTDLCMACHIK